MTVFVGEEYKQSLDELAHYGVKGMRWGQHKRSNFDNAVRTVETAAVVNRLGDPNHPSGQAIRDARSRVGAQKKAIRGTKKEIRKAKRRGEDVASGKKKLAEQQMAFLRNPDRITASRMTKGEAVVSVILGQPGEIAGRALATKLIEIDVNRANGR